jgi:hypothetical protein
LFTRQSVPRLQKYDRRPVIGRQVGLGGRPTHGSKLSAEAQFQTPAAAPSCENRRLLICRTAVYGLLNTVVWEWGGREAGALPIPIASSFLTRTELHSQLDGSRLRAFRLHQRLGHGHRRRPVG